MEAWITKFDDNLRRLFKTTETIVTKYNEMGFDVSGRTELILRELDHFMEVYELSDCNSYKESFDNTYTKYRLAIIKGFRCDSWLKKKNIILVINKTSLNLSIVYDYALELKDDAIKRLAKQRDVKTKEEDNPRELLYPNAFMLHLYRIFHAICPQNEDKKVLLLIIQELEEELQIKKKEDIPPVSNLLGGGLMETVGKLFSGGAGGPGGPGGPGGDGKGLNLMEMFNNPELMKNVGNMAQQLFSGGNGGNFQDTFQSVFQQLHKLSTDPLLTEPDTTGVTITPLEDDNDNDNTKEETDE